MLQKNSVLSRDLFIDSFYRIVVLSHFEEFNLQSVAQEFRDCTSVLISYTEF
jgi:hypothetical protein